MRNFMFWVVALGLTAVAAAGCCANKTGKKGDACCSPSASQRTAAAR